MTKLRGYIPTMLMLVTLMFGATAANAGILVTDRNGDQSKETSLISLAGSVITFFQTGILVTDRSGILVTDRTGILVTD